MQAGTTITQHYAEDHDRLDALFTSFQQLKRVDYPNAKLNFREFKFGLQRHIIWEEEILFPHFERITGMSGGGPTEVMRQEHRQILDSLELLHAKVRVQDPDSDQEESILLGVLASHNQKEEMILYPTIDRLLGEQETAGVFAAMKNVPEERYRVCCKH